MGQAPFICLEQVCASRACLTPDHRQPGNDPGMGGKRNQRRSVRGYGNFYQKQKLGWMGLEQAAGGEPAQLPPEPHRQQLVAVMISARTKWGQWTQHSFRALLCWLCRCSGKPRTSVFDFIVLSLGYALDGVRKTTPCAINCYKTRMDLGIVVVGKSRCPFKFDRATVGKISEALPHELISLY